MERMREWPRRFPVVGDVRGQGLMIGIEFVTDQQTKAKAGPLRDRVVQMAFERGLLVLGAGENVLRLMPPLVIDDAQADCALDILEAAIAQL